MAWTYIYGLVDPRTNRIRYIGKADNPQRRLTNHLADARRGVVSVRCRWLRKLLKLGLVPTVEILEEVPVGQWDEAERWWIARLSLSHDLTNGTHGGDGGGCVAGSDGARRHGEAIRGRKHSAETNAQRKATWARKMADPEWGPAHSARLSEIRKAKGNRPPAHLGEENPAAKMTRASVVEARHRHVAGETAAALAKVYGLSSTTMESLLCGETWGSVGGPIRSRRIKQRLSAHDIEQIRALALRGESTTSIALAFGVHPSHISHIKSGRARPATTASKEAVR